MHQIPIPGVGELAVLLTAVTGVLTVLLVQARGARAEARHRDAETKRLLAGIKRDTAATDAQVSNTHGTNLRDDLDGVGGGVAALTDRLTTVAHQQQIMSAEVGRLSEQLTGIHSDLREVRGLTLQTRQNSHETHDDIYDRLRAVENRTCPKQGGTTP